MWYNAPAQPISSDNVIISTTNTPGPAIATNNTTNCAFANTWSNNWTSAASDIAGVPTTDIWGNNLNNGYLPVTNSGGYISVPSNTTGALNMINASTNAADSAASRIRSGATGVGVSTGFTGITVFSIGLGNSTYPANGGFLQRVANDPASTSFDSAAPTGLYVFAPTSADLSDAFARIAAEILRLAK
jgi:hypothetical protein